eukprot:7263186-Prymnesium_polylepis.1
MSDAGGRGPVSCGTDARRRQGKRAGEEHSLARLSATHPVLLFDGTPVRGMSGKVWGKAAQGARGRTVVRRRTVWQGSAPRPTADPGSPSTSATASHPASRLPLRARL